LTHTGRCVSRAGRSGVSMRARTIRVPGAIRKPGRGQ
jgi:hypothetical protein